MTDKNQQITARPATNDDCGQIQRLVFGVLSEYGLQPDPHGTDSDIGDIEAAYLRRGGVFELLENAAGEPVGTVGLYPIDRQTVELRKMYFAKEIRGRGFGKLTLQKMIEKSRALGYDRIYLETAGVLKEAVGLYKKFGFVPTCEKHTPRCDLAFYLDL